MTIFNEITTPQEMELLVAFVDLTGFHRFGRDHSAQELFDTLSAYFEYVGDIVEDSGGKIVKFIGDEAFIVYPADHVDRGVLALIALKESGDTWLAERNIPCRNIVQVHFGPVVCGLIGTRSDKRFDVYGETVNIAATMKSDGFAITPELFRRLDAATQELFKKHTPPVTYIPLSEGDKDG
jgi:adenylate cyclase